MDIEKNSLVAFSALKSRCPASLPNHANGAPHSICASANAMQHHSAGFVPKSALAIAPRGVVRPILRPSRSLVRPLALVVAVARSRARRSRSCCSRASCRARVAGRRGDPSRARCGRARDVTIASGFRARRRVVARQCATRASGTTARDERGRARERRRRAGDARATGWCCTTR